jgi:hypothetical protein
MTTNIEQITIYSEFGDQAHPHEITISMDGSKPETPITFWRDGQPVFSMGSDEIHEFCQQLQKMDPQA